VERWRWRDEEVDVGRKRWGWHGSSRGELRMKVWLMCGQRGRTGKGRRRSEGRASVLMLRRGGGEGKG
jgi:hypothetical protein